MGASFKALAEDLEFGLGLVEEVLFHPVFPEEEIEKVRQDVLLAIRSEGDRIMSTAAKLMRETLWRDHPYRLNPSGSLEAVEKLTRDDMIRFHQRHYMPGNMVLALSGDFDPAEARRLIQAAFGKLPAGTAPALPQGGPTAISAPLKVARNVDKKQVVLLIGYPGITVDDSRRYIVSMMVSVLSDKEGRLYHELRGKQGLAYYVGAYQVLGLDPGAVVFYIGTVPEKAQVAREGIFAEIEKLRREPVTEVELERAKASLLGDHRAGLQTNETWAFQMALDELYGLGYDSLEHYAERIEAVTSADIQRIARELFTPEGYVEVLVGPGMEQQAASQ